MYAFGVHLTFTVKGVQSSDAKEILSILALSCQFGHASCGGAYLTQHTSHC